VKYRKAVCGTWLVLLSIGCSSAFSGIPKAPKVAGAEAPEDAAAAFRLLDASSGSGRAYTLGVPLGEGSVSSGSSLVVTKEDGTVLNSQWNELVQWRTDGSALHGVLTFVTPDAGDNGGTYYVKEGVGFSGTSITKSDVAGAGFDASVNVQVSGTSYSLSAADLLDGTVTPRQDYTHFSGPLAAEFVVGGALRQNGMGSAHDTLQAYFYVRAFKRPVERVYVTVVLENTGAFKALSDIAASNVDVKVGGASLPGFPKNSFTAYADVRYQKRAWWNGDPGLWAQMDVEQVQDTGLVPEYRDITIDGDTLAGFTQSTDWNERNILSSSALDSGGAKPELAPYDRWTAAYLISGDQRAWNAMRAAQDEYAAMVNKRDSAVSRARDENTGQPIDLGVHGVISDEWGSPGDADTLLANRDGIPQTRTDLAHQPAVGYVTYLLTGETNELENLQFSGIATWLNSRPGGYPGTIPNRQFGERGQVRSLAWGFRELLNAGTVTPAGHPLRTTMEGAVGNALQEMNDRGRPLDPEGATGLWLSGPGTGVAIIYSSDSTPNPDDSGSGASDGVGVATWQQDWLTWAIGSAYERGWNTELDSSGLWVWKAQSVVSRFGTDTNGFCWEYAPHFAIGVQDTSSGPLYSTWGQIFSKNWPGVSNCGPVGGPFARSDGNPTTYGAQIGAALAVAASTGISDAQNAWSVYDQRDTSDWNTTFSEEPEWAVEAR